MLPPPPPPPPKAGKGAHGSSFPLPPPPPPPAQKYRAPKADATLGPMQTSFPKSFEPYGQIQSQSNPGIAHRRTSGAVGSSSNPSSFAYGSTTSTATPYFSPPSSYSTNNASIPERRIPMHSATLTDSNTTRYTHNTSTLSFLLPGLASILWWHDSPFTIQVFLFLCLLLYSLDLINARDALAVAVWICAVIMTITSGIGTLLQVDDADATGGTMILYLLRLAVEAALFCSMVRKQEFCK